jgi:hypothetical protein
MTNRFGYFKPPPGAQAGEEPPMGSRAPQGGPAREPRAPKPVVYGPPSVAFLDLPQLRKSVPAHQPLAAVYTVPWPGRMAVWRSPGEDGFELITTLGRPARIGTLAADLCPGPVSRFDLGNVAIVDLDFGTLASVTDVVLFGGANALAVEAAPAPGRCCSSALPS